MVKKTKPKKKNLPKTSQNKKSKIIKSLKRDSIISDKENKGEIQKSKIDHSKVPKQSKRCSPPSKTPKCPKKNCKITAKHHHGLVI